MDGSSSKPKKRDMLKAFDIRYSNLLNDPRVKVFLQGNWRNLDHFVDGRADSILNKLNFRFSFRHLHLGAVMVRREDNSGTLFYVALLNKLIDVGVDPSRIVKHLNISNRGHVGVDILLYQYMQMPDFLRMVHRLIQLKANPGELSALFMNRIWRIKSKDEHVFRYATYNHKYWGTRFINAILDKKNYDLYRYDSEYANYVYLANVELILSIYRLCKSDSRYKELSKVLKSKITDSLSVWPENFQTRIALIEENLITPRKVRATGLRESIMHQILDIENTAKKSELLTQALDKRSYLYQCFKDKMSQKIFQDELENISVLTRTEVTTVVVAAQATQENTHAQKSKAKKSARKRERKAKSPGSTAAIIAVVGESVSTNPGADVLPPAYELVESVYQKELPVMPTPSDEERIAKCESDELDVGNFPAPPEGDPEVEVVSERTQVLTPL